MTALITTGSTSGDIVVAISAAGLLAPVLNSLLKLFRVKVDRDNVIVTGAGSTVAATVEAVKLLRGELNEVREDLTEARTELDAQVAAHRAQMVELRAEHRQEVVTMNLAHRAQMVELRAQRDEAQQMARRLEARLTGGPAGEPTEETP